MKITVCDRCKNTNRKIKEVWFKCKIGNPGKEVYQRYELCMQCEITILRLIMEKINKNDPSTIIFTNIILNQELNNGN